MLYLTKASFRVHALTFEYHGIARSELRSARALASAGGVAEHRIVRLPDMKEAADIAGARFEGLPPTYIPLRNSIFYSMAASFAEESGAGLIVGGHNRDDAKVFRDVSSDFFTALTKALHAASLRLSERGLAISRPLKSRSKSQVVALALDIGVPLELTWSCHRDGRVHCGRCDGCIGRRMAFSRAGVDDPLGV